MATSKKDAAKVGLALLVLLLLTRKRQDASAPAESSEPVEPFEPGGSGRTGGGGATGTW